YFWKLIDKCFVIIGIFFVCSSFIIPENEKNTGNVSLGTIIKFNEIVNKAKNENWGDLPIGDLTAKIALEFLGTPYQDRTLEGEPEACRVNFEGLDCVTLFENSLDFARIFKLNRLEIDNLINELTKTRYRNGKIIDYTSRLHYTADWIYENTNHKVINDITRALGGRKIRFNCNFMSQNPQYYNSLKNNPKLIPQIKQIEDSINARDYYIIDKDNISKIEKYLESGDIIAVVTSKKGLDYSHTGLIYKDSLGLARFLHASSRARRVVLDTTLSVYLSKIPSDLGVTILRPNEPN
ncbi:MAG: N-acetylmuramoyl-L-alanine amidase-like domain-containing protein, partial [Chloroherpetonaceae bacterium]